MYSNITTSWSSSVLHHIILIPWHQLYNYNIFIFQSGRSVKNYWHSGPTLVLLGSSSTLAFYHPRSYPFHIIPFTTRNLGLGVTVPTKSYYLCVPLSLDPESISQHTNSCRKSTFSWKPDRWKQYPVKRKPIASAMLLTCHSYIYYSFFCVAINIHLFYLFIIIFTLNFELCLYPSIKIWKKWKLVNPWAIQFQKGHHFSCFQIKFTSKRIRMPDFAEN
jgi:hypothetical protein